ncbi:unnamed protein product [Blepharisma stoltei]|uniref:Uncharacterized protein n=1 Tax=Blepharisma stoltei TaxID=1481888 RepID=A0AAU9IEY5_9CILI|nr:unnamed protein product [Blepharisma stoltei]
MNILMISEDSKMIVSPVLMILRILLEPTLLYLFSSQNQHQIPIEFQFTFRSLLYATEFLNIFDRFSHKAVNFNITQKCPLLLSIYILIWVIFYQILIKEIFICNTLLPFHLLLWLYIIFLLSIVSYFLKAVFETEKFSFHLYAILLLILIITEVYSIACWIFHGFISLIFLYGIWSVIITGAGGIGANIAKIFLAQVSSVHDFIKFSKNFLDDWLASDIKGLAKLLGRSFLFLAKFYWTCLGFYDKSLLKNNPPFIEFGLDMLSFPLGYLLLVRSGFSHSKYNDYVGLNIFAMFFMSEMIFHVLL